MNERLGAATVRERAAFLRGSAGRVRWLTRAALIAICLPAAAQAQGRAECRSMPSAILKRSVRYCALLPPGFDAQPTRHYPILYELHGLGDNEQMLIKSGGWDLVEQFREQKKIGEFIIVTPDAGRSFYINSRDGKERYEDFFIKEFIPSIEKRYRAGGSRAARAVGGFSMGGYGALRFAFKYPQLFVAVAVHSAALFEDLPADATAAFGLNLRAFGDPLDPAYWKQNTPFTLARAATGLGRLQIYLDCGLQDDFGFDAGTRALHQILEQKQIRHEFHLYPGGHNWQYVAEHLEASLAFVSRALGASQ
jgi:S-formylglutathione hydrolase FrmB